MIIYFPRFVFSESDFQIHSRKKKKKTVGFMKLSFYQRTARLQGSLTGEEGKKSRIRRLKLDVILKSFFVE